MLQSHNLFSQGHSLLRSTALPLSLGTQKTSTGVSGEMSKLVKGVTEAQPLQQTTLSKTDVHSRHTSEKIPPAAVLAVLSYMRSSQGSVLLEERQVPSIWLQHKHTWVSNLCTKTWDLECSDNKEGKGCSITAQVCACQPGWHNLRAISHCWNGWTYN